LALSNAFPNLKKTQSNRFKNIKNENTPLQLSLNDKTICKVSETKKLVINLVFLNNTFFHYFETADSPNQPSVFDNDTSPTLSLPGNSITLKIHLVHVSKPQGVPLIRQITEEIGLKSDKVRTKVYGL